jgi:glyoxylase-like metal-dependent hydrolase (beta-lactamase superfamily II)
LFTGDAVFNFDGVLTGVDPAFTEDIPLAEESIRKLGALGFERAWCAHGPAIESGASAAIAQLAVRGDDPDAMLALGGALRRCCL